MKKAGIIISLILLAGLWLTACAPSDNRNVIRIGVVAELTGNLPAIGASCRNAAELAVQQVNENGGLVINDQRYKLELFIEDNAADQEQTVAAVQKLINDHAVVAIIGPNASRFAIPAAEVAENAQIPLISPWSTNPQTTLDAVSGEPKDYVLRAAFVDAFQGQVVARFALDYLHAQRAAVLFDVTSEYNRGIAEFFKQTYEAAGGTVVAYETYTTGETDFSAHLSRIKEAAPDLIFLPNYYTDVPLQVRQAHQLGLQVPCMGSDTWGTPELLSLCGEDCEGYYFSTHYSADAANPITTRFVEAYQAAYGQIPDDVAALTYDSFGLLFQALQAAGRADPQKVNDALHQIGRYEGVTGSMLFQQGSGDPIKSAVILQVQAGRFAWFANINP
jgi:branched-chain amino acid transport system substrate-binding protein